MPPAGALADNLTAGQQLAVYWDPPPTTNAASSNSDDERNIVAHLAVDPA